jgi:colicin import membrane protein
MNCRWLRSLLGLASLAWLPVLAQVDANQADERERITRARAAVEARFAQRQAECQTRFAVTDCVDDAKRERREALAPLRKQAMILDDAQRKQRSAQRLEEVRRKQAQAQGREQELVVRVPPVAGIKPAAERAEEPVTAAAREGRKPAPPKPAAARAPREKSSAAERQAQESAAQARFEARRQAAQSHRDAVERRNKDLEAEGKKAAPLPVPASGASR